MQLTEASPGSPTILAPTSGMAPETAKMLIDAKNKRELEREEMEQALRSIDRRVQPPSTNAPILGSGTISQHQRLGASTGIRKLDGHEARMLLFIAYCTQKNVDRGATIEEIDIYMGEKPAHAIIEFLDSQMLTFAPLSKTSRINGMAVEMTRNRRVTDVGMELARQYDDGTLIPTQPANEPKAVTLKGDPEPTSPEFREAPKAVDTDTRAPATAESSANIVVSAKPAGATPDAPRRRN